MIIMDAAQLDRLVRGAGSVMGTEQDSTRREKDPE